MYFNSGTRQSGDTGKFIEKQFILDTEPVAQVIGHDHGRHYTKGNLRRLSARRRQFDNEKNARRQGQQCFGVCKFIPDRDFCPTNVIPVTEEYESDDDYDEDYYSEEEQESSEEYYYEDEEYEDKKRSKKVKRKASKRLTEPRSQNETSQKSQNRKRDGDGLYVVLAPITKYVTGRDYAGKNGKGKVASIEGQTKRMLARRRRHRRPATGSEVQVKQRQPALEQGMLPGFGLWISYFIKLAGK